MGIGTVNGKSNNPKLGEGMMPSEESQAQVGAPALAISKFVSWYLVQNAFQGSVAHAYDPSPQEERTSTRAAWATQRDPVFTCIIYGFSN